MKHIKTFDSFAHGSVNELSAPPNRSNPEVASIMGPKGLDDFKDRILNTNTFSKDQLKSVAKSSLKLMADRTGMNFNEILADAEKQIDSNRLKTMNEVSEYVFDQLKKFFG